MAHSKSPHDSDGLDSGQPAIDPLAGVSAGAKTVMKQWNQHCKRYRYNRKSDIPTACETFFEQHGAQLVALDLYNNCILHLSTLFTNGLISDRQHSACAQKLRVLLDGMRQQQRVEVDPENEQREQH